jgi:hypothetical protein
MRLTLLLSALLVSSATAANTQMAPIGTQLPDGRVVCHVFDEACFARNRQIVCRGNAACEVREMQRQNAGRMAMIQAEMHQRQMQDFGNRLQQAGGWLQSINPGIPAAPSIVAPQRCTYSAWRNGVVQQQCM